MSRRPVPAARLYGRRRMAVLWTTVLLVLAAVNLHFFWTAQHITTPSVNLASPQSSFQTDDGQITSKPESNAVDFNSSAPQSNSNMPFLSTVSQFVSSFSSFILPVPEKLDLSETSSKFSLVTVNPVGLAGPSADPVPSSAWVTAAGDVQYDFVIAHSSGG